MASTVELTESERKRRIDQAEADMKAAAEAGDFATGMEAAVTKWAFSEPEPIEENPMEPEWEALALASRHWKTELRAETREWVLLGKALRDKPCFAMNADGANALIDMMARGELPGDDAVEERFKMMGDMAGRGDLPPGVTKVEFGTLAWLMTMMGGISGMAMNPSQITNLSEEMRKVMSDGFQSIPVPQDQSLPPEIRKRLAAAKERFDTGKDVEGCLADLRSAIEMAVDFDPKTETLERKMRNKGIPVEIQSIISRFFNLASDYGTHTRVGRGAPPTSPETMGIVYEFASMVVPRLWSCCGVARLDTVDKHQHSLSDPLIDEIEKSTIRPVHGAKVRAPKHSMEPSADLRELQTGLMPGVTVEQSGYAGEYR